MPPARVRDPTPSMRFIEYIVYTEKLFRKKFQNMSKTTFLIAEKGKWSKSKGGSLFHSRTTLIEIEVPCGVQLKGARINTFYFMLS